MLILYRSAPCEMTKPEAAKISKIMLCGGSYLAYGFSCRGDACCSTLPHLQGRHLEMKHPSLARIDALFK